MAKPNSGKKKPANFKVKKMARNLIASDRTIQALKPTVKRLNDGDGLHLRQRKGTKYWYTDFSLQGLRYSLSLGRYPEVGLAEARQKAHIVRVDVAHGINPAEQRTRDKHCDQQRKQATAILGRPVAPTGSFEQIAMEWYAIRLTGWSDSHAKKSLSRLTRHVFPVIGQRMVADLRIHEFTALVEGIDRQGVLSTAKRVYDMCRRICSLAVARELIAGNPCVPIREVLRTPVTKHHAAIVEPKKLQEFLNKLDAYRGTIVVVSAMKLLLLTLLRPGELRWARWSEIDFENKVWMVPSARMKRSQAKKLNGREHFVGLSSQAIEILKCLYQITGATGYVCAGQGRKNPVISENTFSKALHSMGYCTRRVVTAHGFRATSRTMLVEQLGWNRDVVELQLDHTVPDNNANAYNRTQLLRLRQEMLQRWADFLDELRSGKTSTPIAHNSFLATGTNQIVVRGNTSGACASGASAHHEKGNSLYMNQRIGTQWFSLNPRQKRNIPAAQLTSQAKGELS